MSTTLLAHTAYIIWSSWAVRQANEIWRRRVPYRGETIMSREGLHHHLLAWAVRTGKIADPGIRRNRAPSVYVSEVFQKNPEAVKTEARLFWRRLVEGTNE